uniref:Uncharacterized protein n=1 Tax=Myotis myotis TaxID=51298 RepID=A0A7J7SC79_MYOMY|nr:hypothetical protein mMyoMyo1_009551 [Myotis myotis]
MAHAGGGRRGDWPGSGVPWRRGWRKPPLTRPGSPAGWRLPICPAGSLERGVLVDKRSSAVRGVLEERGGTGREPRSAALFPPPGNCRSPRGQRWVTGWGGARPPRNQPQRPGNLERSTKFLDPLGVQSHVLAPPPPGPGCCLPAQGVQLTPAFSEACFIFNSFQKRKKKMC